MPIPDADTAYIPPEKLTGYLLNPQHPVGGPKADWFHRFGYHETNVMVLAQDLLKAVRTSEAYSAKPSPFGTKYVVSGTIVTPKGSSANVTTVWIVEPRDPRPRFVTAYPGDKP